MAFALITAQSADGSATLDRYGAIAASYRQREAASYFVQVRSFYAQLEHATAEQVLAQATELGRSCAKASCDGLQPVAIALADRLANFPQVSKAAAVEALAPIFVAKQFPGNLARNFTLPVWNSASLIVRNLRADAVQAMFNRRAALVASGEGKVPMNALLAMGAMQLDFCELDYLPDTAGGKTLGDRERQRRTACDELANDGMNATSNGLPAQSTGPVIDAATASMCASIEVQASDVHVLQRASELAQECFSTRTPNERHSVAQADFEQAFTLIGQTPDADGRQWWEVRVYRDSGAYIGNVYANDEEMEQLMGIAGALVLHPDNAKVSPHIVITPNSVPEMDRFDEPPSQPTTAPDDGNDSGQATGTGTGAPAPEAPEAEVPTGQLPQLPGGGARAHGGEACDALSDQLEQIGAVVKGGAPRVIDLSAGRPGNPTIVNPHPESPWDQSGTVEACSGAIDPQEGAMCNTPVLCNEGFQVTENCGCEPDRQQSVLLELVGNRQQSECASMLCPENSDCACTGGDEEPAGTGLGLPPDKGQGGDPVERTDP